MQTTNQKQFRIVFFGTAGFAVPALEALFKDKNYQIASVITEPDKPVDRKQILTPSPVKITAQKLNLLVLQPEKIKDKEWAQKIRESEPDLIVLAAYGQIIPKSILDLPKYGCLNIHPSLLPKYRGPSPIQAVILSGDKETGVALLLMDEKMDHGPILAISNFPRTKACALARGRQNSKLSYQKLSEQLAVLSAQLLIKTLPLWLGGKIKPALQDDEKATYTKILTREDGRIDWKKSAEEIERQIRAFENWPGTWTLMRQKRLKITEAEVLNKDSRLQPGAVYLTDKKELAVSCGNGVLILKKLQLEGKKEMSAEEFIRGHRNILGRVLI